MCYCNSKKYLVKPFKKTSLRSVLCWISLLSPVRSSIIFHSMKQLFRPSYHILHLITFSTWYRSVKGPITWGVNDCENVKVFLRQCIVTSVVATEWVLHLFVASIWLRHWLKQECISEGCIPPAWKLYVLQFQLPQPDIARGRPSQWTGLMSWGSRSRVVMSKGEGTG